MRSIIDKYVQFDPFVNEVSLIFVESEASWPTSKPGGEKSFDSKETLAV
jgi:hypothetical protein